VAEGAVALDEAFLSDLAAASQKDLVDALRSGLTQADELLRPAYAKALLCHGDSAGLDAFRTGLQDEDPLVRMETVLLLADGPASADGLLGRAAQQVNTPEGMVAEITVAARSGGGSIKPFEAALTSDNRDVRAVSITQFGAWAALMEAHGRSLPDRRVERLLATAVVDPEVAVQRAAVEQIGRLRVGSLDPVVRALLNDDDADPLVRIAAAEAAILLSGGVIFGGDAS
jgi:HEAT repeat protein